MVWLLDAGIGGQSLARLQEICNVFGARMCVVSVPLAVIADFPANRHVSAATYARLLLPTLVDDFVDHCLYLDSDVLVLDDVMQLANIDVADYCLAAVDNSNLHRNGALGMPDDVCYFNAGVTFLNLHRWRDENLSQKVFDYARMFPERLLYWDQDAMNAVLYGCWLPLHPRWNLRRTYFDYSAGWPGATADELKEAVEHPAIVHYTGPDKPWRYLCDHPYRSAYLSYLDKTPWRGSAAPETNSLKAFLDRRRIVVFGAGMAGRAAVRLYRHYGYELSCIVDNDPARTGMNLLGVEIMLPSWLQDQRREDLLVVVASMYRDEIFAQLRTMGFSDGFDMIERGYEYRLVENAGPMEHAG